MGNSKYKAFISYSHADAVWAKWLHKKLESYKFPKQIRGQVTLNGRVPDNFKPVFRDREDLSAGADLGEKIEAALENSENLIVICSPQSAKSKWVNEEILFFKRRHKSRHVFALIVEGEPNSSDVETECLPKALRFDIGAAGLISDHPAEPLAADIRDQGDGKRLGLIKLIAGMAGLELDDLVQRDLQRARQRVTFITLAASIAVLSMGTLTGFAIDARKEAETRRSDAEGLIEFMLTDLRDKLEPVGRLEALDEVGDKAKQYYDNYDVNDHDVDARGRRAEVEHLLGDIQLRMGNISAANAYFEPAFETTQQQLHDDPQNPDRIYEHIQSVFWIAQPHLKARQNEIYLDYQLQYLELANRLSSIEGDSDRAILETAYGLSNVSNSYYRLDKLDKAESYIRQSIPLYLEISERKKTARSAIELSRRYDDLSRIELARGNIDEAYKIAADRLSILEILSVRHPQNFQVTRELLIAQFPISYYQIEAGRFDDAKLLLDEILNGVEQALKNEPNDDRLLRLRLSTIERFVTLSYKLNDTEMLQEYSSLIGEYLDARLSSRAPYDFDQEWDYTILLKYIRNKMNANFAAGDFESAKDLIPKYENLIKRIENRDGFETETFNVKVNYLISRAFLAFDPAAASELQILTGHVAYKDQLENRKLIIALLMHHYAQANAIEIQSPYKFQPQDISNGAFQLFKKRYPDTARGLELKLKSLGSE